MIDEKDKYLIYHALNMWKNWIQTGDINLDPITAKRCGRSDEIKILDNDQMKLVIRLDELAHKELNKEE